MAVNLRNSLNNGLNTGLRKSIAGGPGINYVAGLIYSYWSDTGQQANNQTDFDADFTETPTGTGIHTTVINWDSENNRGTKPSYLPGNYFSWQVEGYIYAATAGTYDFGTGSDDGNQLTVDGTIVTSFYGGRGVPGNVTNPGDTGSIALTAGYHTFRYRQQDGAHKDGAYVCWKPPGESSYVVTPASVLFRLP